MSIREMLRDDRTIAVDRSAGNLAFKVMSWLLVLDLGMHEW